MRNILLVCLLGCILGLTGCATCGPTIFSPRDAFDFNFKVTSDPEGADVFVNDRLFGRTPCEFTLTVDFTVEPMIGTFNYYPKENYVLRVSKEGYRDAIKQIMFYSDSHTGPSLKPGEYIAVEKEAYNFVLEKK